MTATKFTAAEIAAHINATGKTYYNDRAKGWEGTGFSRIYFGREFVTVAGNGEVSFCRRGGGQTAVEIVETAIAELSKGN